MLELKKVQSEQLSEVDDEVRGSAKDIVQLIPTNPIAQSQPHALKRSRVQGFKNTLMMSRGLPRNKSQDSGLKKSLRFITGKFSRGIKSMTGTKVCEICEEEEVQGNGKRPVLCDCAHKFDFCENCLHHYAIYKVNNFEEVYCPHDGCEKTLDTAGEFYRQLPREIQQRYTRVHNFALTINDPDTKMCPKDGCEGLIRRFGQQQMECQACGSRFCYNCLLAQHQGACESQQLQFFEKNLKYRQCGQCKMVIERNQGCNHMKCRCGYQFCYVCGDKWNSSHYNDHARPEDANRLENPNRPEGNNRPEGQQDVEYGVCNFICNSLLTVLSIQ